METSKSHKNVLLLVVCVYVLCLVVCTCRTDARGIPVTINNNKDDADVGAPIKPVGLPINWQDPNVTMFGGPVTFSGPVWFDATDSLYKQEASLTVFDLILNTTILINPNGTLYLANGLCRILADTGTTRSWWSWVPYSSYNGQVYVNGRGPCDEWILRLPNDGGVLVLDVINGTLPVRFIAPGSSSFLNPGAAANTTFLFSPGFAAASYTASNISIFDVPSQCYSMEVCPSGPVVKETFYLFHGANDYTLINTNVADRLGDISFVCGALISKGFTYFSWVSEYLFNVNTTFGQYGLCNFGTCLGGASDRVGQEAADGAAQVKGGQCQANADLGNWYSLPAYNASLCPGGGLGASTYNETVGINGTAWSGCGWKVTEKVKTIDGQCLEGNGFVQACLEDLGYPWTKAIAIWEQAFSSDDPTNGGCVPIVNGTMYEDDVMLENYKRPAAVPTDRDVHSVYRQHLLHIFDLLALFD